MTPPSPPPPVPFALATTRLRVLAAELTDPGRSMRARLLVDEGAVTRLVVDVGVINGSVQGSEPTPYAVRWTCEKLSAERERRRRDLPADHPNRAALLVPDPADLAATCDCIDAGTHTGHGACKHAIAVLLQLAADLGDQPDLLTRWRGVPLDATGPVDPDDTALDHRPVAVEQASSDDARPLDRRRAPKAPVAAVDPLGELLSFPPGARLLAGRQRITPLDPPTPRDDDIVDLVLADALLWMQNVSPW